MTTTAARGETTAPPGEPAGSGRPDYATAIYGSLLVTSLVAVQWRHDVDTDAITVTLGVGVIVFWLAHVWSEIVSHRVHGPISGDEVRSLARAELPMLEAAILPAVALSAHRIPGVTSDAAASLALIVCIGQLFVWGLVVGRAAHTSQWLALRVAIVDSLLGVAIVGLKVLVIH